MDIRQIIFELRSYTPIPFVVIMLIYAKPSLQSLFIGFTIGLIGESLRFWGVSICGSETRTTGNVGATHLVTEGPFSYVRNPLYVGNILMYVGVGIMSSALMPYLQIVSFMYFVTQYQLIVSREEEHLRVAFADEYSKYFENVPRFIPRFTQYVGEHSFHRKADFSRGLQSEMRTLQAFGLICLLIVLRFFFR
jgi:protein-S-isoprenylcysteine O-methyltransferase Ste14